MFKAPRGTADILPTDQVFWRFVQDHAARAARLYGYQRLDTPVFEDYELFARGVGQGTDIVNKEMYDFEDKGGHHVALRPEGTAPVCRAYIEHGMASLSQPVKLYYLSPIFRYERPQAGRFRQHHQFGCEAIGESSPALDAELIGLAMHYFRSLGLQRLELHLNSIGCRQCRPAYHEKLKAYYADKVTGLCPDCRTRFEKNPLRLLDCKEPGCQAAAEAAPSTSQSLCTECLNHHKALQLYLLDLGLNFQLDKRLVRGLDYYNRTVFEIQSPDIGAQAALGGGGRYDDLIGDLGGKPVPAIGFGSGFERVIAALRAAKIEPPPYPPPASFIAWAGDNALHAALRLSGKLRAQGFAVVLGLGGKSLKAQFRQADATGAQWTIILGENELATGIATVKNMSTGEQESVPLDQLESLPGAEPDRSTAGPPPVDTTPAPG